MQDQGADQCEQAFHLGYMPSKLKFTTGHHLLALLILLLDLPDKISLQASMALFLLCILANISPFS
jgi:hypothetical protein